MSFLSGESARILTKRLLSDLIGRKTGRIIVSHIPSWILSACWNILVCSVIYCALIYQCRFICMVFSIRKVAVTVRQRQRLRFVCHKLQALCKVAQHMQKRWNVSWFSKPYPYILAVHSNRAVFERLDRGFESLSRCGWLCCVRLFCVCVVLCVGSGLPTRSSPFQGVLPTV
jgi:hypothetical protein